MSYWIVSWPSTCPLYQLDSRVGLSVCHLFTSQYYLAMECVSACVFDYLRFVYGSLFLSVHHFFVCLYICQFVSLSANILFGLFVCLSVWLFVSVRLSDVYLTVYICQCFSSFVILSVCLFLCVRHFVCLTSFHLSVFFFHLLLCLSVSVSPCASCFVHDSPSIYQCIFPFFTLFACPFVSVCPSFCVSDSPYTCQCFFCFNIFVCVFLWLAACVFTTQL